MNLKELTQIDCGEGKQEVFRDNSAFPTNFGSDFLRNSDNKRDFYPYLIEKIISKTRLDDGAVIKTSNERL